MVMVMAEGTTCCWVSEAARASEGALGSVEEEEALIAPLLPMESLKCDRISESPSAVAREEALEVEDGLEQADVPPEGVEVLVVEELEEGLEAAGLTPLH